MFTGECLVLPEVLEITSYLTSVNSVTAFMIGLVFLMYKELQKFELVTWFQRSQATAYSVSVVQMLFTLLLIVLEGCVTDPSLF